MFVMLVLVVRFCVRNNIFYFVYSYNCVFMCVCPYPQNSGTTFTNVL